MQRDNLIKLKSHEMIKNTCHWHVPTGWWGIRKCYENAHTKQLSFWISYIFNERIWPFSNKTEFYVNMNFGFDHHNIWSFPHHKPFLCSTLSYHNKMVVQFRLSRRSHWRNTGNGWRHMTSSRNIVGSTFLFSRQFFHHNRFC